MLINCDLGEKTGEDPGLFNCIDLANIACGFHAGDALTMEKTVIACLAAGVKIGAHPGYLDPAGFGRRDLEVPPATLRAQILYQIGALEALVRSHAGRLHHVKFHGALYHRLAGDPDLARLILEAVKAFDPTLTILAPPDSAMSRSAGDLGLKVLEEIFADRAYHRDGTLVARGLEGAVLGWEAIEDRLKKIKAQGRLDSIEGEAIDVAAGTLCLHSDTPGAGRIAGRIRRLL
jgi:UPF0271 protein